MLGINKIIGNLKKGIKNYRDAATPFPFMKSQKKWIKSRKQDRRTKVKGSLVGSWPYASFRNHLSLDLFGPHHNHIPIFFLLCHVSSFPVNSIFIFLSLCMDNPYFIVSYFHTFIHPLQDKLISL